MTVSLTKSPEIDPATVAAAIATEIWDISTGNGRDLNCDDWHSHVQNCHAAVANSYTDGITYAAWQQAALARVFRPD